MTKMYILMSSWIVQDGNYPDFFAGRDYIFALQVYSFRYRISSLRTPKLSRWGGALYRFTGRVLVSNEEYTVLDVGIKCYITSKMNKNKVRGEWIEGYLVFQVDPFFWMDDYSKNHTVPNLFYKWKVRRIFLETTPWEMVRPNHYRRADVPVTYRVISQTDAWEDDDHSAMYVLDCDLLSLTP